MQMKDIMEKLSKFALAIIFLMFVLVSCDQELDPIQYVHWVEEPDHGLRVEKTLGSYKFIAQYKPLEYIIAMEERKKVLPRNLVDERKEQLADEMDYFNFQIAPTNQKANILLSTARNEQDYYELLDYMSYHLKQDFYLLDGRDTLPCQLYQFARSYDMSPNLDFVLAFEKRANKDRLLVYDDKVLNTGVVKIKIAQQNIDVQPKLKTR